MPGWMWQTPPANMAQPYGNAFRRKGRNNLRVKISREIPPKLLAYAIRAMDSAAAWSSLPQDDEETRLNKTLITGAALLFIPTGLVWSWGYAFLGLWLAALVPLAASIFLLLGLTYYLTTRHYDAFRTFALAQTLLMPAALTVLLGGFVNSGLVILWSALAPFAAMILENQRRALRWFAAFLFILLASGTVQSWFPLQKPLPDFFIRVSFVMNLGSAFIITFVTAYYFVIQKEKYKARSETLLLNILPKEIAEKLKARPRHIAEFHPQASVLFADIVGFTPLSASMPAGDVVDMLNEVFVIFDGILRKYGLEKIKTIGDCYMAAAGVPSPREDHALALVRAAQEMLAYSRRYTFHGRSLQFRIGMDSGAVVAGVIGRDKFIYDLWGDTVNLASRMESHGLADHIQITRAVYEQIKGEVVCTPRGEIEIKGKGPVETFLIGQS